MTHNSMQYTEAILPAFSFLVRTSSRLYINISSKMKKQNHTSTATRISTTKNHGISVMSFVIIAMIITLDPASNSSKALAFSPPSHSSLLQSIKYPSTKAVSSYNTQLSHSASSTTALNMSPLQTNTIASITTTKAITAFLAPSLLLSNLRLTLSALTATITGGIFAGSLHAIAGPDHLAALLPRCCGLPWYKAARVGAVWGMGHGVSATLLGMAGYALKRGVRLFGIGAGGGTDFDMLHHAGSFMELAIGISLIVIGLVGIKEAREWTSEDALACAVAEEAQQEGGGVSKSLSAAASPVQGAATVSAPSTAKSAVLFNGILHGFSWDGAPSLAPAVAISTWRGSLTFLISYALGTMAAMTFATTVIGEGTRRASRKLDRPDLPKDLSVGSSFLALVVGVVWCVLALR
ncbi:hypothetical protein ACHAWX_007027 [Stephanocyclus meneghinianus]